MKSNSLSRINCNQHGLTLVETTVALGIIVIGVMATITLMLATFARTQQSEHEIVVVNLAREGIEVVRAIRNNKMDDDSDPIDIFDGSFDGNDFVVDSSGYFDLDHQADNVDIGNCDNCQLYLDGNMYQHNGTNPTIFKRMVSIENVSSNEKKVISQVNWTYKGKNHNFTLETNLTNWPDAVDLFN